MSEAPSTRRLRSDAGFVAAPPAEVADPQRLAALRAFGILDTSAEEGFDDIVQLATLLCEAPVALVSFVADDRQWFKARVGFASPETDLRSSVCAHALVEPDLLIIGDLTADPRTWANPLVTGGPCIRFYAGAPLRTREGHTIGSLCVIDSVPRPAGLTPAQTEGLRALARQVMSQLELRRLLHERNEAQAKLAAGAAYWRGLFERLREGMIIGEVVRGEAGAVTDWRYLEVNPAWGELLGLSPDEAVGRTVRELLPGIEDAWVDDVADAVDSGESVAFIRRAGQLGRWYEGRVSPLGPDTFVVLFLDATDRILAEQALTASNKRKTALARLGDHLRSAMDAEAMGFTAAAIAGRTLAAAQAGYAAIDAARETVMIPSTWCAPGVTSIAGQHSFRDYGSYVDDLKAGRAVLIPDVREDARTRGQAALFAELGIVALVNLPVIEHDELVAVFLVLFAEPRALSREEEDFVQMVADRTRAGVARIRAEEQQAILNGEISHRLKNTMAMVQAIANQTLKGVAERQAVVAFEQRLLALSTAHDVLLQKDWHAADLGDVLRRVLDTAGASGRYEAVGPAVKLGTRAALSTSLLLHELATNASKYGALTTEAGKIDVRWQLEEAPDMEELVLEWREVGGPPAVAPTRKGFGSRLLKMGLVGAGGSDVRYLAGGLEATFRAPRKQVELA